MDQYPLPRWIDENRVTYEKMKISNRLRMLRRLGDAADPAEIKALKDRYHELDEPQRLKKQEKARAFIEKKRKSRGK